jgi:hypothetical protein
VAVQQGERLHRQLQAALSCGQHKSLELACLLCRDGCADSRPGGIADGPVDRLSPSLDSFGETRGCDASLSGARLSNDEIARLKKRREALYNVSNNLPGR